MKKKIIILVSIVLVIIIAYFGYKGYNLSYYHIDEDLKIFTQKFDIQDTITLTHKNVSNNNYFEYQNIKIRNDFKEYEQTNINVDDSSPRLVLKDKDDKTIKAFWMGISDEYTYLLESDKEYFGIDDKKIDTDIKSILKDNNINNDLDLFKYLANSNNIKNNIFTSTKKMKQHYSLIKMTSVIISSIDSITLIDGDYEGYIFNYQNNMKEVSIIKNNKRYTFIFMSDNPLTKEYLIDLLSTIVID